MPRIIRTLRAREDLLDIWEYLRPKNADAADRVILAVNERCRTLSDYPHMGRPRTELGENIRSFPVKEYVVFYQPIEDGILVLRVLHAARHFPALL